MGSVEKIQVFQNIKMVSRSSTVVIPILRRRVINATQTSCSISMILVALLKLLVVLGAIHQVENLADAFSSDLHSVATGELQDVAGDISRILSPLEGGSQPGRPMPAAGSWSFDEFLQALPVLSVGLKHAATFECDLDVDRFDPAKLIWVRLIRRSPPRARGGASSSTTSPTNADPPADDVMVISLNQKLITPDRRFRVARPSSSRSLLTLDKVTSDDSRAYFLCQSSPKTQLVNQMPAGGYAGGARLNVLVPPRIVEQDTSPSYVTGREFEPVRLRCKVEGESQSMLTWKREDGRPIGSEIEQRFVHQLRRSLAPTESQEVVANDLQVAGTGLANEAPLLSIDSSELFIPMVRQQQAVAYLCLASNGVPPGVSQRIKVQLDKCRSVAGGPEEACRAVSNDKDGSEDDEGPPEDGLELQETTTTTTTTTTPSTAATVTGSTTGMVNMTSPSPKGGAAAVKRAWRMFSQRNGSVSSPSTSSESPQLSRVANGAVDKARTRPKAGSKQVSIKQQQQQQQDQANNGILRAHPTESLIWVEVISLLLGCWLSDYNHQHH